MSKVDLKNYVCMVPFSSLEIHDKKRFLCCASWLKKYLPESSSPKDAWESDEAYNIRESVLDGSYRYCDKEQCPFLSQLLNFGEIGNTQTFVSKANISDEFKKRIKEHKNKTLKPVTIQFSFDRTCNLKCPSCRISLFTADKKKIESVKLTIDEIQTQYGDSVKTLYITGSGDPFVSVGFRDFLRNFDKSKWPNLNRIHLHTNATKWNKKMWDSMPNIHPYVKTCEISIDAGTKETYETKTRINGDWDTLLDNLKFISTIPTLRNVKTSFVVQQKNYKEMKLFYDLMYSIFGKKVNVFFGKITNWGTFSNEEYLTHQIWNESHPEYNDFVNEVNSFLPINYSYNNLQEFIKPNKTLI
jgi:hypothetical protein